MTIRKLWCALQIAAIPLALAAQAPDAATLKKVDAIFASWDKADSPGCGLAVIRDGQIIHKRGYGMADLEHDLPVTPASVFYIGSTSKQFTAASVALLAQQGKLSLDDDIRKYLPELPDYGKPITVRHLIHHTSGLRDYWTLVSLAGQRSENVYNSDDILEIAARQKELNFPPGEQYLYSNTGYTLLAVIAQRAASLPLREFADANFFQPLGMKSTRFQDDHTALLKNRALGYSPLQGGGFRLNIVNNDLVGAGGLWTTVEDLALWDENFYAAKAGGRALIEQLYTPGLLASGEKLDYAFGLNVGQYKGLKMISHGGAFAGYLAELIRFPEQRFSAAVLCNVNNTNPSLRARQVADIFLSDQFKSPAAPSAAAAANEVKLSDAELAAKAGMYHDPQTETVRHVSLQDGKLFFVRGADAENEMKPLAADRFLLIGAPVQVEVRFRQPHPSASWEFVVTAEGQRPSVYTRVTAVTLAPAQMAEYTGSYFSEELQTTYLFAVVKGKLVLRHKRVQDAPLAPTFADAFRGEQGSLRFFRDPQKRIAGFRLTAGRVRHLRFVRQP